MSIVKREWKIKGTIVIRGWKLLSRGLIIFFPFSPMGKNHMGIKIIGEVKKNRQR